VQSRRGRAKRKQPPTKQKKQPAAVILEDFAAYMPGHSYIYIPTREMWPAASVNARIPPVAPDVPASAWLDRNRAVSQMTWVPGEPMLIQGRVISNGGWIERPSDTCFNLYMPPLTMDGEAGLADPWLQHIDKLYGSGTDHIVDYFAFKTQRPAQKINHALLLGGGQGIGKDTICEPVKYAVGPWNFSEVSPKVICGRFNGYIKSVILRISEARDLGDLNRFEFYEHMKTLTASPPDVLRVDEKHLREYAVLNVCGVVITTNYKTNGIYLPAEDRRHYVAWSDLTKDDFSAHYFKKIYHWYEHEGGYRHVAAYLRQRDVSDFDPKAAPPKTEAFFDIVDANRSPENAGLSDALERVEMVSEGIRLPDAVTIDMIAAVADADTGTWLRDQKNRRKIPYHLESCGYVPVRNESAKDGLWKIHNKRQAVYGRNDLSPSERMKAARVLADQR
jgi:hypothetical protein